MASLGDSHPDLKQEKGLWAALKTGALELTLPSPRNATPLFPFPLLRIIFLLKEQPSYWETAAKTLQDFERTPPGLRQEPIMIIYVITIHPGPIS